MKDLTKKVVILNNFSSPYISEAIIVLKDYNPKLEGHIISEAEKIVSDYINNNTVKIAKKERSYDTTVKRQKKNPHITFTVLIVLAALATTGLLLRIMS